MTNLGAMVRSQPELMLRAMSGSVAMQPQWMKSMAYITTREHGLSGQDAYWGPHKCPGAVQNCSGPPLSAVLWRVGATSHLQQNSGEQTQSAQQS